MQWLAPDQRGRRALDARERRLESSWGATNRSNRMFSANVGVDTRDLLRVRLLHHCVEIEKDNGCFLVHEELFCLS